MYKFVSLNLCIVEDKWTEEFKTCISIDQLVVQQSRLVVVQQLSLLTTLNLSGCSITNNGAHIVAGVLIETISLQNLDLSYANINPTKATKISSSLEKISSLKILNLSYNDIDDDNATTSLVRVINNNHLIERINLSNNTLSYTGVIDMANALSVTKNIKVIDISDNFITCDYGVDLAAALSKCPALQELNISQNLLMFTDVLTVAQYFRYHSTLQSLDLSSNITSLLCACEFIVDAILSVNPSLVNLNVCGRNIRPRYVEDHLSSPNKENNFALQSLHLLQHSSLDITDTQTKIIKATEICPISKENVVSYYVDHLGGAFYNHYHNFAIVIPPGAVSQKECVEIQATASYFGPYIVPEGFYPISSYFWFSANYKFHFPVYLIMNHYAKIRNIEDIGSLHVLKTCTYNANVMNEKIQMHTVSEGVYFYYGIRYCVLATNHFCSYCQAKDNKFIPDYLSACYCTYDECSTHIAEVCLCPSNPDCKKVMSFTLFLNE